jgi:phage-related protein
VTWTVEVLNAAVLSEIEAMPADMQAAFLRLSERIEAVGLERIREPHVKHLRGKLWEMRFSGRDGIGRALYVTAIGRRVGLAPLLWRGIGSIGGQFFELDGAHEV